MKWLLGTYTMRYNRRQKEFGHLFSGRYKALIVDGSGNGYLKTVCDYVHLNPVRTRLLKPGQPLEEFSWSSYPWYLAPPRRRPVWLRVDRLLGEWRIPKDSVAGRLVFAEGMERRRQEDWQQEFKSVERGWCLGGEEFRRELLAAVDQLADSQDAGEEVRQSALARPSGWRRGRLARLGWGPEEIERRRKAAPPPKGTHCGAPAAGDDDDADLDRLRMRIPAHVTHLLYWQGRKEVACGKTLF
jgi:hypothetical protein